MQVSDFDYELPEALIAKYPLSERDASRMLRVRPDGLSDGLIRDLPQLARPGDVWVINDTKVVPARLFGRKRSGGRVEILLLEPVDGRHVWRAWGKSNKPLRSGCIVEIAEDFRVQILSRRGKELKVRLQAVDVAGAIETYGHMPLPPYIGRADGVEDKSRYQTVFARYPGAVAAPTAGLHLTPELMQAMCDAGAEFARVTLHVGPGTFQPVQVERIDEHVMHEETYRVPAATAAAVNRARAHGRRVIAVGTTSLRTLEAAGQNGALHAGSGRTGLFISPGYKFHVADALLTNFHLPRSTLLMLVCALAGKGRILDAYAHARTAGYRFYSYGDAMLVPRIPAPFSNRSDVE